MSCGFAFSGNANLAMDGQQNAIQGNGVAGFRNEKAHQFSKLLRWMETQLHITPRMANGGANDKIPAHKSKMGNGRGKARGTPDLPGHGQAHVSESTRREFYGRTQDERPGYCASAPKDLQMSVLRILASDPQGSLVDFRVPDPSRWFWNGRGFDLIGKNPCRIPAHGHRLPCLKIALVSEGSASARANSPFPPRTLRVPRGTQADARLKTGRAGGRSGRSLQALFLRAKL